MTATASFIPTNKAARVANAMNKRGYNLDREDVQERFVINVVAQYAGGDIDEQVALTDLILRVMGHKKGEA